MGTGQGTITITTTGGTAPYSYSWSDGVNTQNRTNVDAGSYTLTVTDAKNCTANLVVTVPILTQANAGAPQDVCATSTTMAANAVGAGEQGVWAVISGSGTFGTPNSPTSTVTGLALGANVFEWRISDTGGHCTGTTSQVTVNSYAPATVDAGLPQTICAGSPTSALSGTIGGGATSATWSTSGTGSFSDINSLTPIYTPSAADTTAGSVTLTLTTNDPAGPCPPVTDNVVITIQKLVTVNAGTDKPLCSGSTLTLTGSSIGGSATTGTWSIVSQPPGPPAGDGALSVTTATTTPATVTFTATIAGSYTLRLTTNDPAGPCDAAFDEVVITVQQKATVNAGNDTPICAGATYTLTGSSVGGSASTGAWSIVSQPPDPRQVTRCSEQHGTNR